MSQLPYAKALALLFALTSAAPAFAQVVFRQGESLDMLRFAPCSSERMKPPGISDADAAAANNENEVRFLSALAKLIRDKEVLDKNKLEQALNIRSTDPEAFADLAREQTVKREIDGYKVIYQWDWEAKRLLGVSFYSNGTSTPFNFSRACRALGLYEEIFYILPQASGGQTFREAQSFYSVPFRVSIRADRPSGRLTYAQIIWEPK